MRDELVGHGWEVLLADAQKVKRLAPLACKPDVIDSGVLAELSWRDLVPAIWLPDASAASWVGADHRYLPLLLTVPGIGWVLGFTIAAEIGEIERFPTPGKLVG